MVPRLRVVAGVTKDGRPLLFSPTRHEPRSVLRHRLALALETNHSLAYEQLQEHDRAEWLRLVAAGLRDVLVLDYDSIADHCGYHDVRTARRAVSSGRKLLQRLAAWPWWYFRPSGQPPQSWRDHGGGAKLDAAFATWMTGEPHILGPRRAN